MLQEFAQVGGVGLPSLPKSPGLIKCSFLKGDLHTIGALLPWVWSIDSDVHGLPARAL